MSVISARCPYLLGHIEAARKSSSASAAANTNENGADNDGDVSKRVVLCLEHASAETVPLLARYLYADELPSDATSGKTLEALARLANELLLPRLALFRCLIRRGEEEKCDSLKSHVAELKSNAVLLFHRDAVCMTGWRGCPCRSSHTTYAAGDLSVLGIGFDVAGDRASIRDTPEYLDFHPLGWRPPPCITLQGYSILCVDRLWQPSPVSWNNQKEGVFSMAVSSCGLIDS